ncbi:MAG TPA: phosphoribosylaminoimidazolesuccinocarboxamide synthase [Rectinemataceae bacterium]|nr:phosphoribosylaminoimidazolesuccinocarboxamide synthase [Rectinemataceae bacterium]
MDAGETEQMVKEFDLPLPFGGSGKVREWYRLPDSKRLIITTDRISAFDRVIARVPFKGQVLNQLSAFWFERTRDIVPNHLVAAIDPAASVVTDAEAFPVEVIVRGRITGVTSTALWRRYELGERNIYGYDFPEGLRKNDALKEPIVTPTTKGGPTGHDERLTPAEVVSGGWLDAPTWERVMAAALALFERGRSIARSAGLELVDTKYEFGRSPEGEVMLIDEVHTPDSSRFWKLSTIEERIGRGEEPEAMDKEFVRLAFAKLGYRGDGPIPELPAKVWEETGALYRRVYEALTGHAFVPAAGTGSAKEASKRIMDALRRGGYA